MDEEFKSFLEKHVEIIEPLHKELNLAYWQANLSGKDEDYKKYSDLELKLRKIYSDKEDFKKIKKFKGKIKDPILSRQADILYLNYLGNQIKLELLKKIIKKSTKLEKKFNTFRGKMNGKEVTTNEIRDILLNEKNNTLRQKAWEASQQVGEFISKDLIELVKLRNKAAKKLGFDNYYKMSLFLQEQDEDKMVRIFNKLTKATAKAYRKIKSEIDKILKEKYSAKEIMPWHYLDPFFQEAPKFYEVDLDKYYKEKDALGVAKKFYKSIGFDILDILNRSDLFEKPNKCPHAYCLNIDRKGDVRLLMNIKNNFYWMSTILHECGHGIYDKNIDLGLPFLLRIPSHSLTTEAIAMLFGRLTLNQNWTEKVARIKLTKEERQEIKKISKTNQLIFARWSLVMFNFEKALYENPNQNLNKLWWDLKYRYQLEKRLKGRDKADYAAKIHLISSPVYYHNYMLGELFASQLHCYIIKNILKGNYSYQRNPEIGEYLKEKVFKSGAIFPWKEHIKYATGENLNIEYFVKQFAY